MIKASRRVLHCKHRWNKLIVFHALVKRETPLNTQCLQNLAQNGERSDLPLGSHSIPYYTRVTA